MVRDPHTNPEPSGSDTVPSGWRRRAGDTQPSRRVLRDRGISPPPARYQRSYVAGPPAHAAPPPRRRASCCSPLAIALAVLLFACLGLILGTVVLLQWTATPRTNVLILGLDRRPHQGTVVRSDTIVLATVYPAGPRIALLSMPRDLYVEIPGYGMNRINTAHFWGENEAPGTGPQLAKQTVTHNFGVQVHRYVRIDFDGFRAIVDAVGGLDILVEKPVVDNAYPTDDYGTIRIEIPAGLQHMDGETALRYARSRHGSSDFDRAKRQQQIIIALARRLVEPAVWPSLPALYQAVADNVDTDLRADELLLVAPTLYRVGPDGIEHQVIDREMTQPWTTPTGGAVLRPRWEMITPLIQELFEP